MDILAYSMLLVSASDGGRVWDAGLICLDDAEVHRTECCNGRADRTDRWQMWRTLSSGDSVLVSGTERQFDSRKMLRDPDLGDG